MILVPVKNLAKAKQRLAHVLEQPSRTELAQAMLADVLQALAESAADEISLVTSDLFAIQVADHYRFAVIHDDSNLSETSAIEMATRACESRGIQTTLVIPADVPLIEAADIRAIYADAPANGTVLVPSGDQRGSNAVLRRPAALFPLRFGYDSFMPHLVAAIATRTTCVVLSLPRIALDIDTPEDLQQLANAGGAKRSQRVARTLGFSEALATHD
jgi:2-phospho-L-lactate/phosphoenolpyruvate guanylyltransferase